MEQDNKAKVSYTKVNLTEISSMVCGKVCSTSHQYIGMVNDSYGTGILMYEPGSGMYFRVPMSDINDKAVPGVKVYAPQKKQTGQGTSEATVAAESAKSGEPTSSVGS